MQKLIDDLSTIAKIGINDKLGTSSESLGIQKEGIRQSIERAFYGDRRTKSTSYIFNTINTTIALLTILMESEHIINTSSAKYQVRYQTMYSLLTALSRSKQGLNNLLITYHSDGLLIIELREMIQKIDTFLCSCTETVGISLGDS